MVGGCGVVSLLLPATLMRTPVKTLVVDNYDSYTFNLLSLWRHPGDQVVIIRNDDVGFIELTRLLPYFDNVLLSPGPGRPGRPRDMGVCEALLESTDVAMPVLGVCLGHQALAHAFGGHASADTRVHKG